MSIMTRVTQQSAGMLMVGDLSSSLANLTMLQEEAATGKAINQPSDNPSGTSEVLALNAQLGRFQQYTANIADGQAWMNTAYTALGSASKALDQVQTDVLSGGNTTASDASSNGALAQDVLTIKQQLLGVATTTYNNSYIFSGTFGTSPYPQASAAGISEPTSSSYDAATAYAYAGSGSPVTRTVAPGTKADVSITADQVFGTGASSVFALLDTISQDLSTGNGAALSGADLTQLKAAMDQVSQAEGKVGASASSLAQYASQATSTTAALQSRVSDLSDANIDQVATELDLASTSYQAALETTAKIIQPSLVQFLS